MMGYIPIQRLLRCCQLIIPLAFPLFLTACLSSLPDVAEPSTGSYRVNTPIRFNLLRRDFLLHVPPGYRDGVPMPLLLVMHGAFSTAVQTEMETGFSAIADREGFLVAYPEGIGIFGFLQHWNAGHCCGKAAADCIDDVVFVDAVIAEVSKRLAVDSRHIYMAGMSNGGMFTYRYAAERTTTLAAVAVVAGTIGSRLEGPGEDWLQPTPATTLPVVIFHGLADDHIPAAGGKSPLKGGERTYASVSSAAAFWRQVNGCKGEQEETLLRFGAGRHQRWPDCARGSAVELYLLAGWGHQWPAPYFTAGLPRDNPLRGFDASTQIWEFLHRFEQEKIAP